MADVAETIQESLEQLTRNKINSRVALFVAITAKFMALCNVKDGNIVQAMSQAKANMIDSWSYFAFMKISLHSDFISKILGVRICTVNYVCIPDFFNLTLVYGFINRYYVG